MIQKTAQNSPRFGSNGGVIGASKNNKKNDK